MAKLKSINYSADKLTEVINDIDYLSQHLEDEVNGIASLALTAIKSIRLDQLHPESRQIVEGITQALRLIQYRVDDTANSINSRAEDVECNYKKNEEVAHG